MILHEAGITDHKIYQRSDLKLESNVTKASERVKKWIMERLEANDRIVVKTITSEAFKSSPDDFKHVIIEYFLYSNLQIIFKNCSILN